MLIQTGNFASKKSRLQGEELQQSRLKTELQIDVLQKWGLTAIGLGSRDLTLGVEWWGNYLQRHQEVPLVSTNLQCPEILTPPKYIVDQNSGVGILSVFPEKFSIENCKTMPVLNSMADAIEEAERERNKEGLQKIQRWIVMGELTTTDQLQIGQNLTQVDLYFDAKNLSPKEDVSTNVSDWAVFSSGTRGKHVGVVYWSFEDNSNLRISGQRERYLVDLEHNKKTLATAQETLKKIQGEEPKDQIKISRAKNRLSFYENRIKELNTKLSKKDEGLGDVLSFKLMALSREISDHKEVQNMVEETKGDIALLKSENPPTYEGAYVGSSKCQSCHSKQYESWQQTPHAHAYQTLKNVNRNLDYDCYTCHVTGAFDKEGPAHPKQFEGVLENVGCESCHGAGQEHVSTGKNIKIPAPSKEGCLDCHDGIRDEGRFEFNRYMELVRHACVGN